ncbi:L-carnitine dehydrogenase [Roseovarius sp. A-2]|uniref:3-hydroxyacyl-CoA dehydrogenase n=1 Tax=Roseovarius sp. A-2 TaxID=1570360 RepID=UPI0009C699BA|nr:3-hydroxyacyl-CoA dehydrogenase [Roseovarius sp. A-2]GAW33120.1 L-carnitine dehydrogenase [Roseovarius sp. A-2]
MADIPKAAIIGSGLIGCGWAVAFARGGCSVALYDENADAAHRASATLAALADELEAAGMLDGQTAADIIGRVEIAGDLDAALAGAVHVQENVPEKLEIKKAVFADLDARAPRDAILASSTSALLPSAFTEHIAGRERCLVAHPINPPSLIPAVEIVPAPWTSADAMDRCTALMGRIGQKPIRMAREIDGFIMNRLQGALLQEAFRLVANGIASPEDIDTGLRDGLAPRWALLGPFETIDLNAPGGVRDYVTRYGPMYAKIAATQREHPDWTGETLDRIDAARRDRLPLEQISEAQAERDSRLVRMMKHLRDNAPNS